MSKQEKETMKKKNNNNNKSDEKTCPSCGQQCFEEIAPKQRWWRKKKKTNTIIVPILRPLNIEGKVVEGKCLQCHPKKGTNHFVTEEDDITVISETSSISYCEEETEDLVIPTDHPNKSMIHESNNKLTSSSSSAKNAKVTYVYIGKYDKNGHRSGYGEMIFSNGYRYVGQFSNGGKRHGHGKLYYPGNANCWYDGQWECNHMHGHGTQQYPNGDIYIGSYVHGKRCTSHNNNNINDGKMSTFYFANGDKYVGQWFNDSIHGYGRFEYHNKNIAFEGNFNKHGKRHGLGKLQLFNGEIDIAYYNNNTKITPFVRWSKDYKVAWKIVHTPNEGKMVKFQIPTQQAIAQGYHYDTTFNKSSSSSLFREQII